MKSEHKIIHLQRILEVMPVEFQALSDSAWAALNDEALDEFADLREHSFAYPIALAVYALLPVLAPTKMARYIRRLSRFLDSVQQVCNVRSCLDLADMQTWNDYLSRTEASPSRQRDLRMYSSITKRYLPACLALVSSGYRAVIWEYILPPLPLSLSGEKTNFSDGNKAQHVEALFDWLPIDLHEVPNIDWVHLPSRTMGYLVRNVADSVYTSVIALSLGSLIGAVKGKTIDRYTGELYRLIRSVEQVCGLRTIKILQNKEVWEELVSKTEPTLVRYYQLVTYSAITDKYLPSYLESLTTQQRQEVQPYILPPLPPRFLEKHADFAPFRLAAEQHRKAQTDVLAPLSHVLIALIQFRKQVAQRMLFQFRAARQRMMSGEVELPYTYEYDDALPEVNADARTVAEVRVTGRSVRLSFTIWNRTTWILAHPDDLAPRTIQRVKAGRHVATKVDQLFLQFNGAAEDLLWFGDIVQHRLLSHIHRWADREDETSIEARKLAQEWGSLNGFTASQGLLTSPGRFGQWLSELKTEPGEMIFDPESLYRGVLYGTALATITLTNGSRVSELLQVSLDRFKERSIDELQDGKPTGKKVTIYFQHLLPKGAHTEADRQLFPLSPQSMRLLKEIAEGLREAHGEIPIVHPSVHNYKADSLQPERYLFQWSADATRRFAVLFAKDVSTLIRFVLHGLEIYTATGERIKVTNHMLRHVMATTARHEHEVPADAVAFVLHHHPDHTSQSIPAITDYYSRSTENSRNLSNFEFQNTIEKRALSLELFLPEEDVLEQMNEKLRAVFRVWHTLNPTLFGFCGCPSLCPRGSNRELCIACPFLIPDPDKIGIALHWAKLYADYARELHASGNSIDASQSQRQANELLNIINVMRLQQQAIDDGRYIPLFRDPGVR